MTDTFKPGDLCIYVRPGSRFFGEECVVTEGERSRFAFDMINGGSVNYISAYMVRFADGTYSAARPEHLRKKKPPSREIDQVTSWDKCDWKPRELVDA